MYIARSEAGSLYLYNKKPQRMNNCFVLQNYLPQENENATIVDSNITNGYIKLNEELFPELKWEDEPVEVELCEIGMSKRYEELKDSYDSLHMTYLSQISLYKSLYEQEKQKNQK